MREQYECTDGADGCVYSEGYFHRSGVTGLPRSDLTVWSGRDRSGGEDGEGAIAKMFGDGERMKE